MPTAGSERDTQSFFSFPSLFCWKNLKDTADYFFSVWLVSDAGIRESCARFSVGVKGEAGVRRSMIGFSGGQIDLRSLFILFREPYTLKAPVI